MDQRFRRDGWTPQRQLAFLETLARARSVTSAAKAAGMSRESAYRLRRRASAALFAAAWDRVLARLVARPPKGHRSVNRARARSLGQITGFPAFSLKGHKVHDPLDSLIPPSKS